MCCSNDLKIATATHPSFSYPLLILSILTQTFFEESLGFLFLFLNYLNLCCFFQPKQMLSCFFRLYFIM